MSSGRKMLSDEQELTLVEEYKKGASVISLMEKYNFKSKKSIIDKVKKHFPDTYKEIIQEAQNNRKNYSYCLTTINNDFDAYFLGLLLTDGYISRGIEVGIDLIDEDCIAFLSKTTGKSYKTYAPTKAKEYNGYIIQSEHPRHRLILSNKQMAESLIRLGVTPNKTYTLKGPQLFPEEKKFIPYIIRGIIDGDGTVSPTSYGAPQFRIVSQSKDFIDWLEQILTNKMFMIDIHKSQNDSGLWSIGSALQSNILKLISLSYDKPFGMQRKYKELRETFRDYNNNPLLYN